MGTGFSTDATHPAVLSELPWVPGSGIILLRSDIVFVNSTAVISGQRLRGTTLEEHSLALTSPPTTAQIRGFRRST
jgi:hypothetical protein